jgi:hypothetical protein
MLPENIRTKLYSRERGTTIGLGVEIEEAFLLPILNEVEQTGNSGEIYSMLYVLFSAYCPYHDEQRVAETLVRMDSLNHNFLSPLIVQNLHRFHVVSDRLNEYYARAINYLNSRPINGQQRRELYLLKTLELEVVCLRDPLSGRVAQLLAEIVNHNRNVRKYTPYLLRALQVIATLDIYRSQSRTILIGMRASVKYLLRSGSANRDHLTSVLSLIDNLLSRL